MLFPIQRFFPSISQPPSTWLHITNKKFRMVNCGKLAIIGKPFLQSQMTDKKVKSAKPLLLLFLNHWHHFHFQAQSKPTEQEKNCLINRKLSMCYEIDIKFNNNLLTQHATVSNFAKEGKYFCFCSSDPHRAIIEDQQKSYEILNIKHLMSITKKQG